VPERPATLGGYAPVIADYLSTVAADAGPCALAALYEAWRMPQVTAETACRSANTDDDPEDEVILVLTEEAAEPSGALVTRFTIAVFDSVDGAYSVAFVLDPPRDTAPVEAGTPLSPLVDAGDLNNDGGGEFAFRTTACGANTCTDTVFIKKGGASGYADIAPAEGISLSTAEIRFEDTDSDGSRELVMKGGTAGSAGAGPQRPVTQVWAWDGFAYVMRSSTPEPPEFLYHAVKDADALFDAGQYAPAEAAYLAAIGNPDLQIWMPDTAERAELEAYSLLRAAIATIAEGSTEAERAAARATGYLDRAATNQDLLHGSLAATFRAGYQAKLEINVGCAAVRDQLNARAAEYAFFWDFGFANPPFTPASVCPF
jgi:hypothetical protein